VQIISGSIASSVLLRKIPAEAKIIYKDKKGILHGSFRISNDDHIRSSFECRFMIFKQGKIIIFRALRFLNGTLKNHLITSRLSFIN